MRQDVPSAALRLLTGRTARLGACAGVALFAGASARAEPPSRQDLLRRMAPGLEHGCAELLERPLEGRKLLVVIAGRLVAELTCHETAGEMSGSRQVVPELHLTRAQLEALTASLAGPAPIELIPAQPSPPRTDTVVPLGRARD